jgi:hypothetical protein
MLRFLSSAGKANDRKCRLFACACARRIWGRFPAEANRDLVVAVEEHPDRAFDDADLYSAIRASSAVEQECSGEPAYWVAKYLGRGFYKMTAAESAVEVATRVACLVVDEDDPVPEVDLNDEAAFINSLMNSLVPPPGQEPPAPPGLQAEGEAMAGLLRCVVGNPFVPTPVIVSSLLTWSDGLVLKLARAAYDDRHLPAGTLDEARLLVLADALEEAGCTDEAVLSHLRSDGPHVRGCWVLDLVLGKE